MTDRNLRCQVTDAMVATLPPMPEDICLSDITTVMTNVMLSTAAELAQSSEGFNVWGGRGYDDFVPGEVTKTTPSGDKPT